MEIAVGTYTGNGADDRAISTSLTGTPDLVLVKGVDGLVEAVFRTSTMAGDATKELVQANAVFANGIQALNVDGSFQVGTHGTVNTNTTVYYYYAVRDNSAGGFKVLTYVGDGNDNRSITGVGFQPNLVWIFSEGTTSPVWLSSDMAADATQVFNALGIANKIQALEADGFQIGTHAHVNTAATTYHAVCFANSTGGAGGFKVLTYTGDGLDNRSITGAGFQPDFACTQRGATAARPMVVRFKDQAGDASTLVDTSGDAANFIQALEADGFQVGTFNQVNNSGDAYYSFVLKIGSATGPGGATSVSRRLFGLLGVGQ